MRETVKNRVRETKLSRYPPKYTGNRTFSKKSLHFYCPCDTIHMLAKAIQKLMRTDRPECQVGGDSWVGYVLGTVGCIKEGYALGYEKDGIHYTYLDRVEWLCRCGLAPYIPALQREVKILKQAVDKDGICRAHVDENQLKGISTYGGQQLEVDWKTETRKLCDITFRALLIMHYAAKSN